MPKIPTYRMDTDYFVYTNVNPLKRKSSIDCVVRAISLASGKTWKDTYEGLCTEGEVLCDMPNSKVSYEAYLQGIKWVKMRMPRKESGKRYTVFDMCKEFPEGTYILSLSNHLTCIQGRKVRDTWDCSEKSVGNYWVSDELARKIISKGLGSRAK